jgi:hypothetical protein
MDDAVVRHAENQHLMMLLDYHCCCNVIPMEQLQAQSEALRQRLAPAGLPAGLRARVMWRFLHSDASAGLTEVTEDVLDTLQALDVVAEEARLPDVPASLLLEVRFSPCVVCREGRLCAPAPRADARRGATARRCARSARCATCAPAARGTRRSWSRRRSSSAKWLRKPTRRPTPTPTPPRCASGAPSLPHRAALHADASAARAGRRREAARRTPF